MRMKVLRITRKTACDEGSKSWDYFHRRILKYLINVAKIVKQITSISTEPRVEIKVVTVDV